MIAIVAQAGSVLVTRTARATGLEAGCRQGWTGADPVVSRLIARLAADAPRALKAIRSARAATRRDNRGDTADPPPENKPAAASGYQTKIKKDRG